jgi:hypothetical protein
MHMRSVGLMLAVTLSGAAWTTLSAQADPVHENERRDVRQLRDERMTSTRGEARRYAQAFRAEAMEMRRELRAQMRELRQQIRASVRAMQRDLRSHRRQGGWI